MPIRRTYACPECNNYWDVVLTMDQIDDPPPSCSQCDARETQQVFKPVATVNSSPNARANALVEDIISNDYHVADFNRDRHEGMKPKVRYKDASANVLPSTWNSAIPDALQQGLAIGRQNRREFGSGLDALQGALKSGAQPDLIELSKKRSAKIW